MTRRWYPPPKPKSGLLPTGDWRALATKHTPMRKGDLLYAVKRIERERDVILDGAIFAALMSYDAEIAYRKADRLDHHIMGECTRLGRTSRAEWFT